MRNFLGEYQVAVELVDNVVAGDQFRSATVTIIWSVGPDTEILPIDNPTCELEENGMSQIAYPLFCGFLQHYNRRTIRCHTSDECGYYSNSVPYSRCLANKATY